jgi:hypothetical protein
MFPTGFDNHHITSVSQTEGNAAPLHAVKKTELNALLTSALVERFHAPAALTPAKDPPRTHQLEGKWRSGLSGEQTNFYPAGNRTPDGRVCRLKKLNII